MLGAGRHRCAVPRMPRLQQADGVGLCLAEQQHLPAVKWRVCVCIVSKRERIPIAYMVIFPF